MMILIIDSAWVFSIFLWSIFEPKTIKRKNIPWPWAMINLPLILLLYMFYIEYTEVFKDSIYSFLVYAALFLYFVIILISILNL